jgi:hypothetical protein
MHADRRRSLEKMEQHFSEVMTKLDAKDRLIVGKFISLRSKMNFDTGLRIGLQAMAHIADKPVFPVSLVTAESRDGHSDPIRAVAGALKDYADKHGPVTRQRADAAAKVVIGVLKRKGEEDYNGSI